MTDPQHLLCIGTQDIRAVNSGARHSVNGSLRSLARWFRVSYVIPSNDAFDEELCSNLHIYGLAGSRSSNFQAIIRSIVTGIPYKFAKYDSVDFVSSVFNKFKVDKPNFLLVQGAHLGRVGLSLKDYWSIPALLREHNVEYQIIWEYLNYISWLLRPFGFWQYLLTKKNEHYLWRHYDRTIFISDNDMRLASGDLKTDSKMLCIYDGVHQESLKIISATASAERFLLTANADAPQNRISVHWFLHSIWPLLCSRYDDVVLDVIGISSEDLISQYGLEANYLSDWRLNVKGMVDSFQEAVTACDYFISPTVIGSGYRVKLAEAATAGSCAFISAKDLLSLDFLVDGHNCLLFEDAEGFCAAYEKVRHQQAVRQRFKKAIQQDYHNHMQWQQHAKQIRNILSDYA